MGPDEFVAWMLVVAAICLGARSTTLAMNKPAEVSTRELRLRNAHPRWVWWIAAFLNACVLFLMCVVAVAKHKGY